MPWETSTTILVSFSRNTFQLGKNLSFSWDGVWILLFGLLATALGVARLTGGPVPALLSRSQILDGAILLFIAIGDERSVASLARPLQASHLGSFQVGYGPAPV